MRRLYQRRLSRGCYRTHLRNPGRRYTCFPQLLNSERKDIFHRRQTVEEVAIQIASAGRELYSLHANACNITVMQVHRKMNMFFNYRVSVALASHSYRSSTSSSEHHLIISMLFLKVFLKCIFFK